MRDIALTFNEKFMCFDLSLQAGPQGTDLMGDEGLLTSVVISLFTDRRAREDDPLPDIVIGQSADLRGWWGDYISEETALDPIGSRLWLLSREKDMAQVVVRAQEYAQEAVNWLRRDGLVTEILATAARVDHGYLGISIRFKPAEGGGQRAVEWVFTYDYQNALPLSFNHGQAA